MVSQLTFLTSLYILGLLCALPFKKHVPIPFIGASGFLWGMLLWIITVWGWLLLTRQPIIPGVFIVIGIGVVIMIGVNAYLQTWRMSSREWLWYVMPLSGFLMVGTIASIWNYTYVSVDSIGQITFASELAHNGMTDWAANQLLQWPPGLSFLHAASHFVGIDYLNILQPLTTYSLGLIGFSLTFYAFRAMDASLDLARVAASMFMLILVSTWGILFQVFYIHNMLLAGLFLFTVVSTMWLGLQTDNRVWFIFSAAALLGFGLCRLEAPLVAIIFFTIFMSIQTIPYRVRAAVTLGPISAFLLLTVWIWLLNKDIPYFYGLVNTSSTVVQLGALVAFAGLVIGGMFINTSRLLALLPQIMVTVLALGMALFGARYFDNFTGSVWILFTHLVRPHSGWWYTTVIPALALLLLAWRQKMPHVTLFTYSVPSMLMLALIARISQGRRYRIDWGDSLNRMLTYILPIALLYVAIKSISLYQSRTTN